MAVDDSYTKLLLHCNGADASTTFTDEAGKTVTAVGTAQLDTAQKKFGTASGLFDGDSDCLTLADSADWAFGAGNFTIDFWIRHAVLPAVNDYLFFQYVDADHYLNFYFTAGKKLGLYDAADSVELLTTDALTWVVDTWYHIAVVRNGANILIFQDGVSKALTGTQIGATTLTDFAGTLYIGNNADTRFFNGWIDEYRVSKGIARWTANFTPPVAEYRLALVGSPMFFHGGLAAA